MPSPKKLARIVGNNLRQLRMVADLTLNEARELTGVSKSFLSQIENGKRLPSLVVLVTLAEAFGTTAGLDGRVRDTAQAAKGLLGPEIEALERMLDAPASSLVDGEALLEVAGEHPASIVAAEPGFWCLRCRCGWRSPSAQGVNWRLGLEAQKQHRAHILAEFSKPGAGGVK